MRLLPSFGPRYRVERELGRGGMATVYLVRDLTEGRPVAIKLLQAELAAALGAARFEREIHLTRSLDHPNILPVLDSGTAGDGLWYAMPYVEGGSLRTRLERKGQLSIGEAVSITRDVARALDHAHQHGVVHRDVKPENVLLSGDRVLVADFGIAKLLAGGTAETLTATGLSLGTPAYMSPEQAAADPRLDGRADVYALGCMVYEMLAGGPPFTGPTAQAVIARHAMDPVPSLRTVRGTVSPELEAAITRALAKVPADRFDTAGEFAQALASPPASAARGRSWRWRRAAALAALLLASTTGILLRRTGPAVAPSASVMAVLPFSPTSDDTALARLGRDLASTVSANLDGVGEMRMVDRLTILAQTHGRTAPLTLGDAAALGRRLGATSVLTGSLSRDAGRVRVDVGLYSSDSLKPLARALAVGRPDSLGALTDSLTWRVLAEVWRHGKAPTPSIEAVTTRSVEALRAFLDGEAASIAGRHREAQEAYARAIAADSSFWYAYFRSAAASGWWEGEADSSVVAAYRSHRHLFPRRDRLLIDAWTWDSGLVWQRARLEALVQEFPDYWPAWFILADNYVHYYPYIGSPRAEARRALERVVALNPRMLYGWAHLIWMYQADRDTALAARALEALERLDGRAGLLRNEGLDQVLLSRTIQALQTGSAAAGPLLDSLYPLALRSSSTEGSFVLRFALGTASPAAQIALNRRVLQQGVPPAEADAFLYFTSLMWAARGAWDSALATQNRAGRNGEGDAPALLSYRLAVLGTWLGAIPVGQARGWRAGALRAIAQEPERVPHLEAEIAWLDGIDAAVRKDSSDLASAKARLSGLRAAIGPHASLLDLTPFQLALRGDRRAAADRLAEVEWRTADRNPWAGTGPHPVRRAIVRTAAAEWLLELGDTAQAGRLLVYDESFSDPFVEKIALAPLLNLQLARIAEAQGRFADARRDYEAFLVRYDLPPPAHRHLVEEARAAMARISAAPDSESGRLPGAQEP